MTWEPLNEYTITDGSYNICKYHGVPNAPQYVLWDRFKPVSKARIGQFNTSGAAQLKVEAIKEARIIHPQEE